MCARTYLVGVVRNDVAMCVFVAAGMRRFLMCVCECVCVLEDRVSTWCFGVIFCCFQLVGATTLRICGVADGSVCVCAGVSISVVWV